MIGSADWVLNAARLAAGAYVATAPTAARQESSGHWMSVAWERIDAIARQGKLPARDPHATRFATRAGRLACVAQLRQDTGFRRMQRLEGRAFQFEQFHPETEGGDGLRASEIPDRPRNPESEPTDRVFSLWQSTRRDRESLGMSAVQRLRLYLWLVEGWSQLEIAEAFGCGPPAVCECIARAVPPDCRGLIAAVSINRKERSNARTN